MKSLLLLLSFSFLTGCASSPHALRVRALAPTIDEAFRRLTLAVNVDGFEIERMDAAHFLIATKPREAKSQERFASEAPHHVKLTLQLARRSQMYDVILTPTISAEDGAPISIDVRHPFVQKWKRIINSIVQRETRDED